MRSTVELEAGHPHRLSWGAILGGAFVALGVGVLLYSLGLWLGLSSVDPNDPSSLRSAGIGTGIWSAIAPLIALFCGGLVAGRGAGVTDRIGAGMHGAVMWGVTTIAALFMITSIISSLVGGAARLTGQAAGALGSGAAQGQQVASALGIDMQDVLAPVNRELQQQGLPPVTAEQLQAASRDVVSEAVRTGQFNRELLVNNLAQNTELSREQAQRLAGDLEAQLGQARQQAGGILQDVQQGALSAVESTGSAMGWAFFALLLGLGSSILGAALGVSRRQRRASAGQRRSVPLAEGGRIERTAEYPAPREHEVYP